MCSSRQQAGGWLVGRDSPRRQPLGDLTWVKPEKVAPLDERNPSFSDEPSDMPNRHAEVRGNVLDRDKDGQLVDGRGCCLGDIGSHGD